MVSTRFLEDLESVTKKACRIAASHWGGKWEPAEAYWFVWRKVAARAQREGKSPLELVGYACRKAQSYFWDRYQVQLHRRTRLREVSLDSLKTPIVDARSADPSEEAIEREVLAYWRTLPERKWRMLIAPYARTVSRTARELNVSRQRVHQVHNAELEKLRRWFYTDPPA
jgi:hypothetical protein